MASDSRAVVVFCEASEHGIRAASLPALAAGARLAQLNQGTVVALVIGSGIGAAAQDAARYASKVLAYDDPALGTAAPLAETFAPLMVDAVKRAGASALLGTATSSGKDILPRAAALLGAGMVSDVIAVSGPNRFRRPAYAGNTLEDVEVTGPVVVASIRQSEFAPATPTASGPGSGAVENVPIAAGSIDALGAEVVALHETVSARPDLGEAKVVVSGGRGMREGANFKILEQLTDLLGGALGASRAACDAGMVPNDLQVGQTGKVVAPDLYIAVAISGAIQHLAGMKGSKVIVAINKDPEAPIFQVADYGLVGTWEAAIPALIAEIQKLKGGGGR
jgi:electron transfer flavoprotein alpha subunit